MRIDMKDMTQPPLAGEAHCFRTDPDRHCDKPNTCLLRYFSAVNFSPLKPCNCFFSKKSEFSVNTIDIFRQPLEQIRPLEATWKHQSNE